MRSRRHMASKTVFHISVCEYCLGLHYSYTACPTVNHPSFREQPMSNSVKFQCLTVDRCRAEPSLLMWHTLLSNIIPGCRNILHNNNLLWPGHEPVWGCWCLTWKCCSTSNCDQVRHATTLSVFMEIVHSFGANLQFYTIPYDQPPTSTVSDN